MPKDFPHDICNINNEDKNPAIQLFGRRFISNQQILELLSEFLLVLCSSKRIGEQVIVGYLPSYDNVTHWLDECLEYSPKAKINLKLFAFLGTSRLETRHKVHRDHFIELWQKLLGRINADSLEEKESTLQLLCNLFLGFWGVGLDRTWCAQTFLPFAESLLIREAIWKEKTSSEIVSWEEALSFFKFTQHDFLARGGELLYLQLCNALRQSPAHIEQWLKSSGRWNNLRAKEQHPKKLLESLDAAFQAFFRRTPSFLNKLADFIDTGVDQETADFTDGEDGEHSISCGWCPEESWREGYLFAIELLRLLETKVDLLEMVEQLEMACALQLLRSLTAQSYRHTVDKNGDGLCYHLMLSNLHEDNRQIKDISKRSTVEITRTIHDAIRMTDIQPSIPSEKRDKMYQDADNKYGYKLYRKIGKSIDLIVPKTGNGMRFVISPKLLRHLVLSLVPYERMTLDTFLQQMKLHHGFELAGDSQSLENMLEAGGMLVKLSDSCSLVKNPFFEEN